jgi:deoxycytidylate deaminase
MSYIRDNRRVIIGLTGYSGSGCTELAKYLAFKFIDDIKVELKRDSFSRIEYIYERLDNLSGGVVSISGDANEARKELKNELEKREIRNVIKRNRSGLQKPFFYISFSSMIVYFLIRYIKSPDGQPRDKSIYEIIEGVLEEIGMTVGSALDLVANFDSLTKRKKYTTEPFRKNGSSVKGEQADQTKLTNIRQLFDHFHLIRDRIISRHGSTVFQDFGDNIRKTGQPYHLAEYRKKRADYRKARFLAWIVDKYIMFLERVEPNYTFFVIECFKNPQELYYFREKYSYFYLFALDTKREIRKERRKDPNYESLEQREKGEENQASETYKLNVPRCIDLADVVIKNNEIFGDLFWKVLRYFALILEPGCVKPTQTETMMHQAYTLSVRSNCISRQVGALITNRDGYIIGAGWNDVGEGQISCGLKTAYDYGSIDYLRDTRVNLNGLNNDDYVCFKDRFKTNGPTDHGLLHCLALHAEENAILQLAKYDSDVPTGGTMYSTAFPCPLCLKKINQVGISKIIYTESYSNPIASNILEKTTKDIKTESFEGVKYYSYFRLFKPYYDRKEQQELLRNR